MKAPGIEGSVDDGVDQQAVEKVEDVSAPLSDNEIGSGCVQGIVHGQRKALIQHNRVHYFLLPQQEPERAVSPAVQLLQIWGMPARWLPNHPERHGQA